MSNDSKKVNIYDCESQSAEEMDFFISLSSVYRVFIYKKNKAVEKRMTPSEIEKLLIGKQKYKMVAIFSEKKEEIYSMLSNVSQAKGICSPFIEVESGIMYFPQLTYSDVGFLKSLCEQRELNDYKIRLVSTMTFPAKASRELLGYK